MRTNIILFVILCFSNTLISQSLPAVFVEDDRILDVIVHENETFYATTRDIIRVDSLNNESDLDNSFGATFKGRFKETSDGWVYLGWQYLDIDVFLPIIFVKEWHGDTLIENSINLFDFSFLTHIAVSYRSKDSIYVLENDFDQHKIHTVNSDSEVYETHSFTLPKLIDMEYLGEDINLLVGKKALYTVSKNNIIDQIDIPEDILYWSIYKEDKVIEVLTSTGIFSFDYSLDQLSGIMLPQNERTRVACKTYDDQFYLVERIDNQSYITTLDAMGKVISEYEEHPNVMYTDMYIVDDIYNVWGQNRCHIGSNLLKTDEMNFQSEIPTQNLEIEDLVVLFDGETIDTVQLGNGDTIYYTNLNYSWEVTVANNGENPVDEYKVSSYRINEIGPPIIEFLSESSIESGQSITHEGTFSTIKGLFFFSFVKVWVGSDYFDEDCSDNTAEVDLPTSTLERQVPELMLYPNPTSDILKTNVSVPFSYRIFDITGSMIDNRDNHLTKSIDVSVLSKGIYIIEFMSRNKSLKSKFIKI